MNTAINHPQPLWKLLFGIVDRPIATFQEVLARRKWWIWAVPLLIVLLCFVAVTAASAPLGVELARDQMERQLASMPASQAEEARAQMETFVSLPFILVTSLVSGTLMLLLGIVGQAAILYFGALVAGGEVEFGPVFTMSTWTRLPTAIRSLVQAGFIAFSGRSTQYLGLAALVATGDIVKDARNPLVTLLAQLDLFWLWHLLLVVLGLSVAARFSRVKSLILTLIYAALALALTTLPSLLFGGATVG